MKILRIIKSPRISSHIRYDSLVLYINDAKIARRVKKIVMNEYYLTVLENYMRKS